MVLFVSSSFLVAIIDYLLAVFLLAFAFMAAYRRHRQTAYLVGFFGLGVTLAAAVVQQMGWDINRRYFTHDALYHVLQAAGLAMIFLAAKDQPRD